jgi:single-stranded-DNA-specific exonuclease
MPFCPVINPKREDSEYPWRGLSGCGVAFKLTQAIKNKYFADDSFVKSLVNEALDLVAIATVADVMPLLDENRTLVKYGLDQIRQGKREALALLCEQIGLKTENIRAYNIGFGIAPHINAAGRMDLAAPVVELFLTDDHEKMVEIISDLIRLNQERRKIQDEAIERCKELVNELYADDLFLLVKDTQMHEGISGIVAGKIRETFNKPTAVLSETDFNGVAVLKGSGRSMAGVNIIGLLQNHAELFLKLGGHAMAAGFTLEISNEEVLRAALNADMNELLKANPELFDRNINPDIELDIDEADVELAEIFDEFEPCGMDNQKPLIAVRGGAPVNYAKRVGADQKHLSFKLGTLSCIWFSAPDDAELKLNSNPEYYYGTLSVNEWNGYRNPQLTIAELG